MTGLEYQVGPLLRQKGYKLAAAESCTGGLIAALLTDVPGSSEYFEGGVVAYAYEAKVALLGVSWDTLHAYGAVSAETVLEMAHGVRNALNVQLGVSVSGIAGPGGGLPGKPVGTVWIALEAPDGAWAHLHHFPGDRAAVRKASSEAALQLVMDYLEGRLT